MKLYILLDTSGSMEGAKIAALNDCMSNIIIELQEKAFNGMDIQLAVLSFAREVQWMYDDLMSVLDFSWKELKASGMTSLGKACLLLSSKLKDGSENNDQQVVVLLSDGCPTDDYDEGIAELHKNQNFNNAEKFAIALGDNADVKALTRFVDDATKIYLENNADNLLDTLGAILGTTDHPTRLTEFVVDNGDEWD